jgi:hypothetical protein
MTTSKLNIYFFIGITFLLLTWLFVGVFRDSEFHEPFIFTKYKPTFKIFFHTPIGESDLALKDLSTNEQREETAFQEFVIKQDRQYNSNPKLWYLPFILIQFTLTFLSFGILRKRARLTYINWRLPVHFLINLIFTSTGLTFLLSFDKTTISIFSVLIILSVNYWTTGLFTRRRVRLAA